MSSHQQRLTGATATRLAVLTNDIINLNLQLCELNRLRDLVAKAQLSARKSRRTNQRKKAFRWTIKAARTTASSWGPRQSASSRVWWWVH